MRIFDIIDTDEDGLLSVAEVMIGLGRMGHLKTSEQALKHRMIYRFAVSELDEDQFLELLKLPETPFAVLQAQQRWKDVKRYGQRVRNIAQHKARRQFNSTTWPKPSKIGLYVFGNSTINGGGSFL